ncbi:MAG TPA: hypothetical protein VKX39_08940 [Bryobacteraceae bacterium]|jgi:hypothetical protein|nr:hypothetical protein [Bryobacteraceae bacterium]
MSLEAEIKAGALERGRYCYFPVVPGRLEFSIELRRRLLAEKPPILAVELPGFLEKSYRRALARLPEMSVILYTDESEEERAVYVPVEPADPFTEALRTAEEIGAEVIFLEPDSMERPHLHDAYPDTYAIRRVGLEKYIEAYRLWPQTRTEEVAAHASAMAWKLQGADLLKKIFVVVSLNLLDPLLDAMEAPQPEPARGQKIETRLLNPHPDCLAEITIEYPYLQERYEFFRLDLRGEEKLDRPRAQLDLLREAEAKYSASTGEKMAHWQRRIIARFTRNLAQISGELVANAYDLAVAARSVVDDNYGWEVWQMANRYLAQQETSDLETVRLSAGEIWINTKKLRIRRRLPRPKQRLKPAGLKPRKREKYPGEWARQTTGDAICSYPPEDLVIEEYGRFLKQKAKAILSEERVRVEPFTTSILDGIDIRETIRNWHRKKIFVRKADRLAGEVGAVVVIFDEDREDRYQYLTTWLGEHQNESDMAFYSTYPFDHLVGPGIGRAEYGGFLMTLPPRRLFDVWSDPDYDFTESKPERLLMAGLDYSVEKFVVYVAAKPPRSIFRSIAAHLNRKILYVPIGQLSPAKIKKIRVVHVLDNYDRRADAKDYLW